MASSYADYSFNFRHRQERVVLVRKSAKMDINNSKDTPQRRRDSQISMSTKEQRKQSPRISMRLLVCALIVLCASISHMCRVNLSLAIVSMVKDVPTPTTTSVTNLTITSSAQQQRQQQQRGVTYGPKYEWSQSDVGRLNGAFFFTYVIFQIPAARLAEHFSAKWILAASVLGSSIFSLLSPLAASLDVWAFICVRFAMGACQSALYPTLYTLFCKWLPESERAFAITISEAGAFFGPIVSSIVTGYVCETESLGWKYAFYIPGFICTLWICVWILVASSSPFENRFISDKELDYLKSNLEQGEKRHQRRLSWGKILTSQPVWALVYTFSTAEWSFSVIMLILPLYLNDIIGVSPLKNGAISASIYSVYCVVCPVVSLIATKMIVNRTFGFSKLQVRKLFQCLALFGTSIGYIILPQIYQIPFFFLLLIIQIMLSSLTNGGYIQVPTELSFEFSGSLFALCNTMGNVMGFLVPVIQSKIVTDKHSRDQYATFFYCTASVLTNGALIFLIFGSNHPQDFSSHTDLSPLAAKKATKTSSTSSI